MYLQYTGLNVGLVQFKMPYSLIFNKSKGLLLKKYQKTTFGEISQGLNLSLQSMFGKANRGPCWRIKQVRDEKVGFK